MFFICLFPPDDTQEAMCAKVKGRGAKDKYSGSLAHVCIYMMFVCSDATHVRLHKATFLFQGLCGRHFRGIRNVCLCSLNHPACLRFQDAVRNGGRRQDAVRRDQEAAEDDGSRPWGRDGKQKYSLSSGRSQAGHRDL